MKLTQTSMYHFSFTQTEVLHLFKIYRCDPEPTQLGQKYNHLALLIAPGVHPLFTIITLI